MIRVERFSGKSPPYEMQHGEEGLYVRPMIRNFLTVVPEGGILTHGYDEEAVYIHLWHIVSGFESFVVYISFNRRHGRTWN